jgi:uncharacterized membrane protein
MLFTALYFLYKQNIPLFTVIMMLSLLIKEDMPLVIIPIFVYVLCKRMYTSKFEKWLIIIGTILSIVWLVSTIFVIIPAINTSGEFIHTARYSTDIPTMISQYPMEKLSYLSDIFSPLLFLPLLSPVILLTVVPTLLEQMLQEGRWQFLISSHYVLRFIPILFLSMIFGLKYVVTHKNFTGSSKKTSIMLCGMFTVLFLITSVVSPIVGDAYIFQPTDHTRTIDEAMTMIPDGASLHTCSYYIKGSPHRMELYAGYHKDVDYIFLDTTSPLLEDKNDFGMVYTNDFYRYDLSEYRVIFDKNGIKVYQHV